MPISDKTKAARKDFRAQHEKESRIIKSLDKLHGRALMYEATVGTAAQIEAISIIMKKLGKLRKRYRAEGREGSPEAKHLMVVARALYLRQVMYRDRLVKYLPLAGGHLEDFMVSESRYM